MKKLLTFSIALLGTTVLFAQEVVTDSTAVVQEEVKTVEQKMEYDRSSLSLLMVYHPEDEFAAAIDSAYHAMPFPDKYDEHNIGFERIDNSTITGVQKGDKIGRFYLAEHYWLGSGEERNIEEAIRLYELIEEKYPLEVMMKYPSIQDLHSMTLIREALERMKDKPGPKDKGHDQGDHLTKLPEPRSETSYYFWAAHESQIKAGDVPRWIRVRISDHFQDTIDTDLDTKHKTEMDTFLNKNKLPETKQRQRYIMRNIVSDGDEFDTYEEILNEVEPIEFNINNYSIFGTHLNIEGCINKKLESPELILKNKVNLC